MTDTISPTDVDTAELLRLLADAEARALRAERREDFAQGAFEAAKKRADLTQTALQWVLIEYVVEPATGELETVGDGIDAEDVPRDGLEQVADSLIDDLVAFDDEPRLAELVNELPGQARRLLNGWAEER